MKRRYHPPASREEHTPGPWKRDGMLIVAPPLRDSDQCAEICQVFDAPETVYRKHTEADVRLIAAAPELLAACKAAMEHGTTVAGDQIVAAIKKAEATK